MTVLRTALAAAGLALVAGCSTPATGPVGPAVGAAQAPSAPGAADKLAFQATTLDGAPFAGASLRGRPSVLWFWAPWCTVCKREAPSVAAAAAANPGITFVGVSARDELPAMRTFVRDQGLSGFTHLEDARGSVWSRFGVIQQPSFAFIGRDGSVEVVTGDLSAPELSARLAELGRS